MQFKNIKQNQQRQLNNAQSRMRIYKVMLIPIISLALKVCGMRVLLGRNRSLLGAVSIADNARQGHQLRSGVKRRGGVKEVTACCLLLACASTALGALRRKKRQCLCRLLPLPLPSASTAFVAEPYPLPCGQLRVRQPI